MYYNQELGLCIEFGPVRVDSVRRGGGPPLKGRAYLYRFHSSGLSSVSMLDCHKAQGI